MKLSKVLAITLFGAIAMTNTAMASGTVAGTKITNQPVLEYSFGNVKKVIKAPEASYIVDKVINFTLKRVEDQKQSVIPGREAYAPFMIKNIGNSAEDFSLSLYQSGTRFKTTNIYIDTNNNGNLDEAEKKSGINKLPKLAVDAIQKVWVQGLVDKKVAHASILNRGLIVRAIDTKGKLYSASSRNDMSKMDIVFADVSRNNHEQSYYIYKATEDATNSNLTTTLYSVVKYDPVNKTSYPKAIPGAVVLKRWYIRNYTKTLSSGVLKFKIDLDPKIEKFATDKAKTGYTSSSYGKGVHFIYHNGLGYLKNKGVKITGNSATFEIPALKPNQYAYVYMFTEIK
jgi:hypothetical protein